MRFHLLFAFLLVLAVPAWAASDYETLAAQTPWKTENGRETRSLEFPGGVVIFQERQGDKVSSTGVDRSGRGAVLCLAQIYLAVQAESELCQGQGEDWTGEIGAALDRIYSFIEANSLTPITKDELVANSDKQIVKFREQVRKRYERFGDEASVCRAVSQGGLGAGMKKKGLDAFRADIDKALAVPRPPVMNPCL